MQTAPSRGLSPTRPQFPSGPRARRPGCGPARWLGSGGEAPPQPCCRPAAQPAPAGGLTPPRSSLRAPWQPAPPRPARAVAMGTRFFRLGTDASSLSFPLPLARGSGTVPSRSRDPGSTPLSSPLPPGSGGCAASHLLPLRAPPPHRPLGSCQPGTGHCSCAFRIPCLLGLSKVPGASGARCLPWFPHSCRGCASPLDRARTTLRPPHSALERAG